MQKRPDSNGKRSDAAIREKCRRNTRIQLFCASFLDVQAQRVSILFSKVTNAGPEALVAETKPAYDLHGTDLSSTSTGSMNPRLCPTNG